MENAKGRAFCYGADIDTDVIIPARYLNTSDPKELAVHCMEDSKQDINAGLPVFSKRVKEGDIIAYGLSGGVSVLHRVVETDKNSRIWRTKGDANEVSDPGAVSYEQYLGKMIFSLPYVGYLISVFKRRSIWLGTIAVGILLIILQQKEIWKSGKEKTV